MMLGVALRLFKPPRRTVLIWVGTLLAIAAAHAEQPVKVLIVTGGHDHEPSFYSLFDDQRFIATVNPHPEAFTRDFRERADVLVLYDLIPEIARGGEAQQPSCFRGGRQRRRCSAP